MKPTEQELQDLIGQCESMRLEFKSAAILRENQEKIIAVLTKEVSSFANSEGGRIVIGLEEKRKSRPPVAETISGYQELNGVNITWLQQVIESNLKPYLPGIRFWSVELNSGGQSFVIDVPKGTTAYQAKDLKYYGRSEFQVNALPDHEIRLRMNQSKVSRAIIEHQIIESSISRQLYTFIRNNGDKTIMDFRLKILFKNVGTTSWVPENSEIVLDKMFTYDYLSEAEKREQRPILYPEERIEFPLSQLWHLGYVRDKIPDDASIICQWKLFLHDSPAIGGEFDILSDLRNRES